VKRVKRRAISTVWVEETHRETERQTERQRDRERDRERERKPSEREKSKRRREGPMRPPGAGKEEGDVWVSTM